MTLRSSLYVGSVMHRRLRPRKHRFRYRAFWFLLDLDELDKLSSKLRWFSYNRSNIFSFYDVDHGDGTAAPIRTQIERQLAEAQVDIAGGRIRLLCMPRTLGYCFNPISIYFCYQADASLAALVYQVHNTFGERHSYVIRVGDQNTAMHQRSKKLFYVSPFLDMDMRYDFRITGPDERIAVGIRASSCQKPVLNAVLTGARSDLTDRNLMSVFLKIPVLTIKVIAAIHWEALRLWAKGTGLRQRPPPPKRPATIVTTSSVIAD
jgi:uncharacterized protein